MELSNSLIYFTVVFFFININLLSHLSRATATAADHVDQTNRSSIIFATLGGKSIYSFDIFSLPIAHQSTDSNSELRLTDGQSLNFNGHFPSTSSVLSLLLPNQTDPPGLQVVYVTERNGLSAIYLDAIYGPTSSGKRSILEVHTESTHRVQVPLVGGERNKDGSSRISMKDRPILVDEYLVYVSTHEDPGVLRASWVAVYSTHLRNGVTRRLTPYGVADFSPAVSPSGEWTAVASYGEKGWDGEVEELGTDIYVFLTRDGSRRVKLVEHGGWPSWADELTLYFHRRSEDGWWSVYKAILPGNGLMNADLVVTQRVTPPGLHAFTPAASTTNKRLIAIATRRPDSDYRHIELFDVLLSEFKELTRPISPHSHHFNPFFSPDSIRVGYHRCRGSTNTEKSHNLFLENLQSPVSEISLFRVDGSFPSFSADGDRIAYVNFPGLYVVNVDGSGLRKVLDGTAFATAWDRKRKGVVYTSLGPTFESESTEVDVVSVNVDDDEPSYKKLTHGEGNNAFPSPSPDGKWVVFRSGRTGYKNLYIMDAAEGETGGLQRLTEGPWSDTMANWSPDGDWIAFSSDRENPGSGSFELYMIHPNGTGLHKLIQGGSGGKANHPYFRSDGRSIVFTSDYAAVSAEPISNSHQYQPYGEIYTIRSDGSGLKRLTHNSFEDGTPAWVQKFMKPVDVEWSTDGPKCSFDDLYWLEATNSSHEINVARLRSVCKSEEKG